MERAYLFAKSRLGSIDASIKLTDVTHSISDFCYAKSLISAKQHTLAVKFKRKSACNKPSLNALLKKHNHYLEKLENISEQTYIIPKKNITAFATPYFYTILHKQKTYEKKLTISHCAHAKTDLTKALDNIKGRYPTAENLELCQPTFTLEQCDFSYSTLKNYRLAHIFCHNTTLLHVVFDNIDLFMADFSFSRLAYSRIINTNLRSAKLDNADFSSATLRDVDLSQARLYKTNMQNTDLRGSIFVNTDLSYADLRNAKLQGVDLHQAKLAQTQLSGADITSAFFNITVLKETSLQAVDFSGSILIISFEGYGSLKNINIKNMHIKLKMPCMWNAAALAEQLNHIDSPWESSLLTYIGSIDNGFINQKIHFIHEIIDSLKKQIHYTDSIFPRESLLDFFATNKYFMIDFRIKDYIIRVLYAEMADINKGKSLSKYKEHVLYFMFEIISAPAHHAARRWCMLDNNNFFIQLIAYSVYSRVKPLRQLSRAVYREYLTLPEITPFIKYSDIGSPISCQDLPDWSGKHIFNYILVNKHYTIIINHEDLSSMIGQASDDGYIEWDRFFLYKHHQCQALAGVDYLDLFRNYFTLFYPMFKSHGSLAFDSFLKKLRLAEYENNFRLALRHSGGGIKYTDPLHQKNLDALFSSKLDLHDEFKPALTTAHYREIIAHFALLDAKPTRVAQIFLSLSAMFTLYSSDRFFGTEHNSPHALRNYAYALMRKSFDIAPNVVGTDYDNWANRLLGLGGQTGISCCSDMLSREILSYARVNFADTVSFIVSPACA